MPGLSHARACLKVRVVAFKLNGSSRPPGMFARGALSLFYWMHTIRYQPLWARGRLASGSISRPNLGERRVQSVKDKRDTGARSVLWCPRLFDPSVSTNKERVTLFTRNTIILLNTNAGLVTLHINNRISVLLHHYSLLIVLCYLAVSKMCSSLSRIEVLSWLFLIVLFKMGKYCLAFEHFERLNMDSF